jgi:hypothetical protein
VFDRVSGHGLFSALDHLVTRGPAVTDRSAIISAPPELADILPDQGFRRGAVVRVGGLGATTLLLAALTPAVQEGSWLAVLGMPTLGVEAAAGLGLTLERLVLVPHPGRRQAEVVAALVDTVDVVVLGATAGVRSSDARRLAARVRERHGLLVVAGRWPEPVDLRLDAADARWSGLDFGDGKFRQREITVTVAGRRSAVRPRKIRVLLPAADGRLCPLVPVEVRDAESPLRALAG